MRQPPAESLPRTTEELLRLGQEDEDIATLLDTFSEVQEIYLESRRAMGQADDDSPEVKNSAEVTISFSFPSEKPAE